MDMEEAGHLTKDQIPDYILREQPHIVNSKGELKKFMHPREYISMIHPRNMGRPHYENHRKNLFILGSRGWGKSYSMAGIVTHEYLFDGMTHYDLNADISAAEVVVGAGDAKYSTETLLKVKIMIDKLPGEYKASERTYPAPFFKRYAGSWAPARDIRAEYKESPTKTGGTGSSIKHRTFKDNPYAANGTRPGIMLFEEVGFFDNLKLTYGASVECQRDGAKKIGSMLFIGTGGDMEGGSTQDAHDIFYNPDNYDCLAFDDTWEFKGKIGYFLPAYLGLKDFKDNEGITDVPAARTYLEKIRDKLRNTKGSSLTLEKEIINRPIVPSEMFLQGGGNIFPVAELRSRLSDIDDDKWSSMEKVVSLYFDPKATQFNGVNYKIDVAKQLKPINQFPWKEHNRQGAAVIYEFPQLIDGRVPEGAYIIGHDPYSSDSETGESLASIIVLKTKKHFEKIGHDEIVAVYYGRPFEGRHIVNEMLYKLGLFYNAEIFFENSVGNVKEYFEKIKKLPMLARRPRTILNKRASYEQSRSYEYGYPMSSRQMKLEGAQYIREWLLEPREQTDGKVIRNLDKIWDRVLLNQLIAFNLEGNFDAVMGLMGAIIGLNERYNQFQDQLETKNKDQYQKEISDILINNKFIFKNARTKLPKTEVVLQGEDGQRQEMGQSNDRQTIAGIL